MSRPPFSFISFISFISFLSFVTLVTRYVEFDVLPFFTGTKGDLRSQVKGHGRTIHTAADDVAFANQVLSSDATTQSFSNLPPISIGACCGIGHRLSFNLKALVYAALHDRQVVSVWRDVPWSALFDDCNRVVTGTQFLEEHYGNDSPKAWLGDSVGNVKESELARALNRTGAVSDLYKDARLLFDNEIAWSVVADLQASLSPSVKRLLEERRKEYRQTHLCAHFRFGNNETGDWEKKKWRQVTKPEIVMDNTLKAMLRFAAGDDASVFLASDTPKTRVWFENNAPQAWKVVRGIEVELPESGVWFGQWGSKTGAALTNEQRNDKMAEAAADVFALGECDALFIPTYSSFTISSIILTRRGGKKVFFRKEDDFIRV